ncbi:hypothetical protein [Candidatus Puniceispirillum marinum]|uniref:Lipoprotein n=1 Tax=Puniceispirillum marinum (strain IMCC1322) TaxID=488538 RepID=D5BTF7_PUNMI|nr:hypothetical protein [Candidatus Puniceispirillum marinum]ADE39554.1 hypothetical protein SAR116_1311 [Candidatus Puniceispirillum marinum IMCC1322]
MSFLFAKFITGKFLRSIFACTFIMLLGACDDAADVSTTQKITINGQNIEASPEIFETLASLIKRASSSSSGVLSSSKASTSEKEENQDVTRGSAIGDCHNSADAVFQKISSLNHDGNIELNKNKFEVKLFSSVKFDNLDSISNLEISIDGSNCMVMVSFG